MTSALNDPDIQEAVRCAQTCLESDRDSAFKRMAEEVISRDPVLARIFISEIKDPDFKTPVLLDLCLSTLDLNDIQGLRLASSTCETTDPRVWLAIYRAVWLFANGQLAQAREACLGIEDILFLIKLRIFFARHTKSAVDQLLLNQTTDQLQSIADENARELGEHIGHEFIFIAKSKDPYWLAKVEWLKVSRRARLNRLINLEMPPEVLTTEICLIAGTGLTNLALQLAKKHKTTLDTESDEYNYYFSVGYSIQCQVDKARRLAEKIRDPEKRALAFVQLYLARLNN
jgi:hypothetical protein